MADVSHGCADDVSSNSDPLAMVSIRPSDPSATSCTHAPSGSMVNTMSECRADSRRTVGDRNSGMDIEQAVDGGGVAVEHCEIKFSLCQVAGHGVTHDAETDEADSWAGHDGDSNVSVMSQWPGLTWRSAKVKANGRSVLPLSDRTRCS